MLVPRDNFLLFSLKKITSFPFVFCAWPSWTKRKQLPTKQQHMNMIWKNIGINVGIKKVGINFSPQKVTISFSDFSHFLPSKIYADFFLPTKIFADFFLYRLLFFPIIYQNSQKNIYNNVWKYSFPRGLIFVIYRYLAWNNFCKLIEPRKNNLLSNQKYRGRGKTINQ